MTSSLAIALGVIVVALVVAAAVGALVKRRSGVLREGTAPVVQDSSELGLSQSAPTVPEVAHVEIDLDANPAAAKQLSVLSLPTTFIFDADGRQRYRASGVPKVADLRSALTPLLA
jgi:hypothetical protein